MSSGTFVNFWQTSTFEFFFPFSSFCPFFVSLGRKYIFLFFSRETLLDFQDFANIANPKAQNQGYFPVFRSCARRTHDKRDVPRHLRHFSLVIYNFLIGKRLKALKTLDQTRPARWIYSSRTPANSWSSTTRRGWPNTRERAKSQPPSLIWKFEGLSARERAYGQATGPGSRSNARLTQKIKNMQWIDLSARKL